jgi:hypothetical protein
MIEIMLFMCSFLFGLFIGILISIVKSKLKLKFLMNDEGEFDVKSDIQRQLENGQKTKIITDVRGMKL